MADKDDKGGQGTGDGGQGAGGTPPAGQGQGSSGTGDSGGGLEATIRRVVQELMPKGRGGGAAAEHDVTAQVEAAVAKVHKGQQAEQVIRDLETRLKAVESRPVPEKKPREYRSITKAIWGGDDDD